MEKLSFTMFACLFHQKHLVPREEVIFQLLDAKMDPDTVQHVELKKNLLLDVKGITRYGIFK